MSRSKGLAFFILLISITSGYLMSKASLVGKAGMSLFYREYNFLKSWWKGGLLILVALTSLYYLHWYLEKRYTQRKTLHIIAGLVALTGLYFTYNDFRHTLSHRLLGERFHIGVYLFWIGWMVIILYFLMKQKPGEINELRDQQVTSESQRVD